MEESEKVIWITLYVTLILNDTVDCNYNSYSNVFLLTQCLETDLQKVTITNLKKMKIEMKHLILL